MIFFCIESFTTALKWLLRHLHIRHSNISFSCHPSDCWNFSLFHRWPLIEKAPPADLPIKIGLIFIQNSYPLPSMQVYDFGLQKMPTIIAAK